MEGTGHLGKTFIFILYNIQYFQGSDIFLLSELLEYFTSGPEAPLYRHYINCSTPICSGIGGGFNKHKGSIVGLIFQGVHSEFLSEDKEYLFTKDLINVLKTENFDLNRIHDILKRKIEKIYRFLEGNVHTSIFSRIKLYQNYAPEVSPESDNLKFLDFNNVQKCEEALTYGEDYWKGLVDKYFDENYVVLYTTPSTALIEKEKAEEDERLKKQAEDLGEEGLKKCAEILEQAVSVTKASQATPEMLNKYAIDELIDFKIIPVERSAKEVDSTPLKIPKVIHKTGSSFVVFKLIFSAEKIPKHLYPLMKLYMNIIDQSSAWIDGTLIPCEELSRKRKSELISFGFSSLQNKVEFGILSTIPNVSKAPMWMDIYLNKLVFEKSVIIKVLKKMLANAEQQKRSDRIIQALLWSLLVELKETIEYYYSMVQSEKFYKYIFENLEDEKFVEKVIEKLNELKDSISKCDANLHLIGNPEGIEQVDFTLWPKFTGEISLVDRPEEVRNYSNLAGKSYCISRPECTSAYFNQGIEAPFDIKSLEYTYSHLLNSYFCERGGIVRTEVRGKGYAYHVELSTSRNIGLKLTINNASNLPGAYEVTKKCILETIQSGKLDPENFEAAKRSWIMKCINSECTISQAGENSFTDHMRGFYFEESYHQ